MVFEDPIENSRKWELDLEDIRIVTLTRGSLHYSVNFVNFCYYRAR